MLFVARKCTSPRVVLRGIRTIELSRVNAARAFIWCSYSGGPQM